MSQVAETAEIKTEDGFILTTNEGTADQMREQLASLDGTAVADPDATQTEDVPQTAKPRKGSLARVAFDRDQAKRERDAARQETATERERIAALEARIVEAEAKALKPPAPAVAAPAAVQAAAPQTAQVVPIGDKFPLAATWLALPENAGRDWDDWNDAKSDWKIEQRLSRERQQTQFSNTVSAHQSRVQSLKQTKPDYDAVVAAGDQAFDRAGAKMSPAIEAAILNSPRSADIVYDLASHPEIAIQLAAKYANLPLSAAPVVQDLLESRLTVASSGPAVVPRVPSSAKPVNKPLTGTATTTVTDEPPGDDASIEEHDRYYAKRRRQYR